MFALPQIYVLWDVEYKNITLTKVSSFVVDPAYMEFSTTIEESNLMLKTNAILLAKTTYSRPSFLGT